MGLQLPYAESEPLSGSHLEVVVCQIRYEQIPRISDFQVGRAWHEHLGGSSGLYPRLERHEVRTEIFQVGADARGSSSADRSDGWSLRARDGEFLLTLMPDHISVETTHYGTWSNNFRQRLHEALEALRAVAAPQTCSRLGLRYVNRLPPPASGLPTDWVEQVEPALLGALSHPILGAGVISQQQQVELQISDEINAVFRHGALKDAGKPTATVYLLDYDVFTQVLTEYSVADALSTADALNDVAFRLFRLSVTDAFLARLRSTG